MPRPVFEVQVNRTEAARAIAVTTSYGHFQLTPQKDMTGYQAIRITAMLFMCSMNHSGISVDKMFAEVYCETPEHWTMLSGSEPPAQDKTESPVAGERKPIGKFTLANLSEGEVWTACEAVAARRIWARCECEPAIGWWCDHCKRLDSAPYDLDDLVKEYANWIHDMHVTPAQD